MRLFHGASYSFFFFEAVRSVAVPQPTAASAWDARPNKHVAAPPSSRQSHERPGLSAPQILPEASLARRLTNRTTNHTTNLTENLMERCGAIAPYLNLTTTDWTKANTGAWLDAWWEENNSTMMPTGFAKTVGSQFLGDFQFSCVMGGSAEDCAFTACDQSVLNGLSSEDMQSAYHVLQSMSNLHGYFTGMRTVLSESNGIASLSSGDWAWTFYKDKNDISKISLKEIINIATSVVAFGAAFAAPLRDAYKIIIAGTSALWAGGFNAAKYKLQQALANDTPLKAADVGAKLAQMFQSSLFELINANDLLMQGKNYNGTGDIRTYMADGAFLDFQGIDIQATISNVKRLILSTTINILYKQQKVFIVGGGPCDDSGGIGQGPQNAKYCRDGKAWYLFFWKEYGGLNLGKKAWGDVQFPPGAEDLDGTAYEGLTVQDIISSSLDAHLTYQNASFSNFSSAASTALGTSALNTTTATSGPHWPLPFSIPVCNIAPIVSIPDKQWPKKPAVLQPYGGGKLLQWCKPMCANASGQLDKQTSLDFLNATNMWNFKSPSQYCPDLGETWLPWRTSDRYVANRAGRVIH